MFFAHFTEDAPNWVKPVRGKVIGVLVVVTLVGDASLVFLLVVVMFVYVGAKRFFMFGVQRVEIRFLLKEFHNGYLYVGEGEKFFYTHYLLNLYS